jgi:hypothetical protein
LPGCWLGLNTATTRCRPAPPHHHSLPRLATNPLRPSHPARPRPEKLYRQRTLTSGCSSGAPGAPASAMPAPTKAAAPSPPATMPMRYTIGDERSLPMFSGPVDHPVRRKWRLQGLPAGHQLDTRGRQRHASPAGPHSPKRCHVASPATARRKEVPVSTRTCTWTRSPCQPPISSSLPGSGRPFLNVCKARKQENETRFKCVYGLEGATDCRPFSWWCQPRLAKHAGRCTHRTSNLETNRLADK